MLFRSQPCLTSTEVRRSTCPRTCEVDRRAGRMLRPTSTRTTIPAPTSRSRIVLTASSVSTTCHQIGAPRHGSAPGLTPGVGEEGAASRPMPPVLDVLLWWRLPCDTSGFVPGGCDHARWQTVINAIAEPHPHLRGGLDLGPTQEDRWW